MKPEENYDDLLRYSHLLKLDREEVIDCINTVAASLYAIARRTPGASPLDMDRVREQEYDQDEHRLPLLLQALRARLEVLDSQDRSELIERLGRDLVEALRGKE